MNAAFWRERRVLVTGATGMVGAWLVKALLAQGAYVVALVRDADPQSELLRSGDIHKVSVVNGDLTAFWDLERAINKHEIDTVFHLGAQTIVGTSGRMPLQTFEANIRGSYNLLEACRLHSGLVKRIVVASSDKAYGTQPTLPYTEDMPLAGQHPYEVSKSCTDLIAQTYARTYGLPVTIARCGNIYGGGDLNWSRIVPGTIRALLARTRPLLRSDGTFVRDYVFVQDIVDAYVTLAELLQAKGLGGEAFNFSAEAPLTVLDMVEALKRLMQCPEIAPEIQNSAQGEIKSQYLDSTKARTVLAWRAKHTLDEGLSETIAWYRSFLSAS